MKKVRRHLETDKCQVLPEYDWLNTDVTADNLPLELIQASSSINHAARGQDHQNFFFFQALRGCQRRHIFFLLEKTFEGGHEGGEAKEAREPFSVKEGSAPSGLMTGGFSTPSTPELLWRF